MKVEAIFNEKEFRSWTLLMVNDRLYHGFAAKNPAHFRSAKSDKP
jgi:hypothetical protein